MKKITRWVVRQLVKDYERITDTTVRNRYGVLQGWFSVIVNVALFILKIFIGISIKSVSLIADAIHTLSDSGTSIVIMVGFRIARKPSDKEHPFGHGRMESVAALVVAVLLFAAGVEVLDKAVHSVLHPHVSTASIGIILLIASTILIKELMARFSYELGEMIDSQALKADALHHRTDVFATALVVVALVASRFGINRIDGIMGVFVALIIFYSAYSIAKNAIGPLLGEAPAPDAIMEIERLAKAHPGVLGVHDVIFHKYGQTSIISLHIEVPDNEPVSRLHTLSEEVEEAITEKMGGMVVAHIDPINKDHPQYDLIAETIKGIIAEEKRAASFHELRIVGCKKNRCNVVFDISLAEDTDEGQAQDIISGIRDKFKIKFPEMKTVIIVEPRYTYSSRNT